MRLSGFLAIAFSSGAGSRAHHAEVRARRHQEELLRSELSRNGPRGAQQTGGGKNQASKVERGSVRHHRADVARVQRLTHGLLTAATIDARRIRSEERRVGKECRSRRSPYH